MSFVHLSRVLPSRTRRLSPRNWGFLAAAVALAIAGYGVLHLPILTRIRLHHEVKSFFTQAPVLLLGDSIAYADGPGGLCGEQVFNAAVPGARVADLLDQGVRIADRVRPQRVVLAIGVNDAIRGHLDLEKWSTRYRQLVASLHTGDLTLVEVNPVDMSFPSVARTFDPDLIAQQNAVIREVAAQNNAHLVKAPRTVETADGLHPDANGAVLWRARLAQTACLH